MKIILKKIVDALFISVFGYLFVSVEFVFLYLIMASFANSNQVMAYLIHLTMIGMASWAIFKSKISTVLKAAYLAVPLAAVYVGIGMFFGGEMAIIYSLNAIFLAAVLYSSYRLKLPWQYFFATALTGLSLFFLLATGGEV